MNNEQKMLLDAFYKMFENQKGSKIALYGLGINTPFLLNHIKQWNVVGLMDAENAGKVFYGYPVLSSEEAVGRVDDIIIVARPDYQNLIYRRIRHLEKYGIRICNLYGMSYKMIDSEDFGIEPYWEKSSEDLGEKLKEYDVISFDVFDTLLVRRVLQPYHIFDRMESKVCDLLGRQIFFREYRMHAERIAEDLERVPSVCDIYAALGQLLGVGKELLDKILALEIQVEKECLIPRVAMRDLFFEAHRQGKCVILVSDMYFPGEILEDFLRDNGYHGWKELIVSSEYGKSKKRGDLYDVVREKYSGKRILHIGDNEIVDGRLCLRHGIDSYLVKSSYGLLQAPFSSKLQDSVHGREEVWMLGEFAACVMNNPFVFHANKGKLEISDGFSLGYSFFAPLVMCFVRYLLEIAGRYSRPYLLLSARDGYCLRRVLDMLSESFPEVNWPLYDYFLTSRRAICLPTFSGIDDIIQSLKRITGTVSLSFVLEEHFSMHLENGEDDRSFCLPAQYEELGQELVPYLPNILQRAEQERNGYLAYLRQNFDLQGKEILLFDLMSSGTIPLCLGKLLDAKVSLLAFCASDRAGGQMDIHSMLEYREAFGQKSSFQKYYRLWEAVMTAPEGQLERFSEEGVPVFRPIIGHVDYGTLNDIWDGIFSYAKNTAGYFLSSETDCKRMADEIFGTLVSGHVSIGKELRDALVFEDRYLGVKECNVWSDMVDS